MDLWFSLLAGVLGSLHCVGMCGAIVLAYSAQKGMGTATSPHSSALATLPLHLVYNGGRVLSYTVIGGFVGALGGLVKSVQAAGVWFSIAAGSIMVLAGLLMLGIVPRLNIWEGGEGSWLRKLHVKTISGILSLRTSESAFLIGVLTPLLPCGLLYSMFFKAAETGSPGAGALIMFAFGVGIVPALVVTGLVSSFVGLKVRSYANKLAALTIIIMGVVMIMRGAGIPLPFMGAPHEGHHQEERMEQPREPHMHFQ